MEQPELGKNEEEQHDPSSAELPETGTAAASDTTEEHPQGSVAAAGDAPTEADLESEDAPEMAADALTDEPSGVEDDEDDAADESAQDAGQSSEEAQGADESGLRRGDVILGTITRTTPNEIFVDIGDGREGIVPKREVELMSGRLLERMQEGAEIHVYVVNPRNHRGNTILSINHAQEELDWRSAEEYLQSKEVYDGKIGGYNRGGLIVRFGRLRGFVPQSQISDKRMLDVQGETPEERYGGMVNDHISVKVMEVDRSRNRLILSERAAMREVRQRRKETLITELEVGEVRQGRVVSLENFGAFVDVGGAEGLVHLTELSWEHVTHPRQVLNVGEEVEVKVINVDQNKNRIGLSIKQLIPDPWDELATRFGTGALIRGTVTKLTKFGAFAKVEGLEAVEGLIHISELSDERVEHPRDVVQKGDRLTLRVVKIDVPERRLGLSLRRVHSAEFLDEDLKRAYRDQEENQQAQPQAAPAEAEAPAEEAAAEVADEVEAPAEEAPAEAEAPAEEAAAEVADEVEAPAEEAPAEAEAPAEEAAAEVADEVEAPAEEAPAEEAEAPAEESETVAEAEPVANGTAEAPAQEDDEPVAEETPAEEGASDDD